VRVPEDIALIGIDDIEEGRYVTPALTTIAPDNREIGGMAAALLIERIHGIRNGPPEHVQPPFVLVVRKSTAAGSG
jgi:DNA-binding LacI/PurR family transcriptional regulator